MCGIAGVLNLDSSQTVPEPLLREMTSALAHRGPDDEGVDVREPVGFGHRRLSILDLESGHQPMWDDARAKGIVFNGEIYNYREIRERRTTEMQDLRTNCDTEVLLRLATSANTEWLSELNGMFAFALWDERERCLMLARDRLGIKPLYYTIVADRFWFASEIKALLRIPELARQVNQDALAEYLVFRRQSDPATLFEGIHALAPGHVLRVRPGGADIEVTRYWADGVPAQLTEMNGLTPEEQFEAMLAKSVGYRLLSDVPVGTYNSGGVDSTLTTAAARRLTTGELHTFSVGFDEGGFDESRYAQIVADRIGTTHHLLVVNSQQYADAFLETIWFNDEPLHHAHTVQLRLLSRLAKEFVTVVLTGEGADEDFAGYPRYQIPLLAKHVSRLPGWLTTAALRVADRVGQRRLVKLLELGHDAGLALREHTRFVPQATLRRLGLSARNFAVRGELQERLMEYPLSDLERILIFDRATYMPSLLHRLDRTTMASGLEARVPYLDHNFVDWSKSLPAGEKLQIGRENKVLVKRVAARSFPREMIYRRKMGFDVPIGNWLRSSAGFGAFLDLLRDEKCLQRGYFAREAVTRLVDEHRSGRFDHGEILWELINLEAWHRQFVDL